MLDRLKTSGPILILALATVIGAALRLFCLDCVSLWNDEMATWEFASMNFQQIWGSDTHPPLYYLIQSAVLRIGDSPWTLRFPSVVLGVALIPLVFLFGRQVAGPWAGAIAASLIALSGFHLYYGQEARMYSLLALAGAISMIGLVTISRYPEAASRAFAVAQIGSREDTTAKRLVAKDSALAVRRGWIAYAAGALIGLYTHNSFPIYLATANLALIAVFGSVLWQDRETVRTWLVVHGAILAGWAIYLPWSLRQIVDVVGDFWVEPLTLTHLRHLILDIYGFGYLPTVFKYPAFLLCVALGLWGLASLWRRHPALAKVLAILISAPFAILALIEMIRPLFLARVLIWTTVPAATAVAIGVLSLPYQTARVGAVLAVVAALSTGAVNYYGKVEKAPWDKIVQAIANETRSGDIVLCWPLVCRAVDYYLIQLAHAEVEVQRVHPSDVAGDAYLKPLVSALDGRRAVVVHRPPMDSPSAGLAEAQIPPPLFDWPARKPLYIDVTAAVGKSYLRGNLCYYLVSRIVDAQLQSPAQSRPDQRPPAQSPTRSSQGFSCAVIGEYKT